MITFEPLWETLQEKNISQYTLIKKLVNGHPLSTDILINSVFDGYYLTINFENTLCCTLSPSFCENISR